MSDELFPSGPWTGFYQYSPRDKHSMDLSLTFASGRMTGDGSDDVGRFIIKGRYDSSSRECFWIKTYPDSHVVFYWGYRDGKGIWGRWEIATDCHGGFHIWPRTQDQGAERSEAVEKQAPFEVITNPALAPAEPNFVSSTISGIGVDDRPHPNPLPQERESRASRFADLRIHSGYSHAV